MFNYSLAGCFPLPCANNATCTVVDTFDYTCKCPDDLPVGGKNCDQLLVPQNPNVPGGDCKVNPCQNGGYCQHEHHNIHACQCANGYWGRFCEQAHPCISKPGLCNAGKCIALENNLFHCHCSSGFNGALCENQIVGQTIVAKNVCDSNPCRNNGYCRPLVGNKDFQCVCSSNFTGKTCDLSTVCTAEYCGNHGFCQSKPMIGRTCSCDQFYTGKYCEERMSDPCSSHICLNGGSCYSTNYGTAYCLCSTDYTGNNCEAFRTRDCNSYFCINGGLCTMNNNRPVCLCAPDFQGDYCQIFAPVAN
ncbi:unnamed protein product [Adineta ricciae]|uniref:EGF-like domain-containing protein n=1 Tax=Adineta ricciae TaxID=249248 RepID=A0A814SV16_ADIRI|nr:unnamed protein product [Adineta ricciae]